MTQSDMVVVLTALNLEYEAIRKHIVAPQTVRHGTGTRFETGTVVGGTCRIALGLTGTGNTSAAVLAERAIQQFRPAAVLFVGVAGSLWESPGLGDIVVASRVYAYHGGTSEDDGLKARPRVWEAPHELSQLANHLARTGVWKKRLNGDNDPSVTFGPIAAGEIVQNSRVSAEAKWIRQTYNDAVAIEMEGAGLAQAGHLNSASIAIVRGISDRADGHKTTSNDGMWQPRAAANAAAFALQLADDMITERTGTAMSQPRSGQPSHGKVFNVSSGTVGIQGANISGTTVHMSSTPVSHTSDDVAAAITALRNQLHIDHANGEMDDDTYDAALSEIDAATTAVREPADNGRKRVALSLKRLGGLAAGTTNVAANIAHVLTAVEKLS